MSGYYRVDFFTNFEKLFVASVVTVVLLATDILLVSFVLLFVSIFAAIVVVAVLAATLASVFVVVVATAALHFEVVRHIRCFLFCPL